MRLRKFNENKEESDEEIIKDCATIITYEFEDIVIDIDDDVILIQLNNWVEKYGDISIVEKYLEFNIDYIKFNQLLHTFLQEMGAHFGLYMDRMPDLTFGNEQVFKIKFKRLGPDKFRFIFNPKEVNKSLLKNYFEKNISKIVGINFPIKDNKYTKISFIGVDESFIKNIDNLDELISGLNKINPIRNVSIGFIDKDNKSIGFRLRSEDNKIPSFYELLKTKVDPKSSYDTILDNINDYKNIHITFEFRKDVFPK
jgi:hypothetical protein